MHRLPFNLSSAHWQQRWLSASTLVSLCSRCLQCKGASLIEPPTGLRLSAAAHSFGYAYAFWMNCVRVSSADCEIHYTSTALLPRLRLCLCIRTLSLSFRVPVELFTFALEHYYGRSYTTVLLIFTRRDPAAHVRFNTQKPPGTIRSEDEIATNPVMKNVYISRYICIRTVASQA
jgi:hypothetical protein